MSPHSSDIRTNKLVLTALMVCLVLLGTILFRIPVPMTQGYVHLGDAMVYTGVLLLGKKQGAVAAALGSSLADVLGGFAFWAPWSFFIKFAMAFAAGYLVEKTSKIVSMTAGGLIMCTGYLIAERVIFCRSDPRDIHQIFRLLKQTVFLTVFHDPLGNRRTDAR